MEERDLKLIDKYSQKDEVLAHLWQEHLFFEKQLEKLESKSYLKPEEEMEVHRIKKKKLLGRDRIEAILSKYRAAEA